MATAAQSAQTVRTILCSRLRIVDSVSLKFCVTSSSELAHDGLSSPTPAPPKSPQADSSPELKTQADVQSLQESSIRDGF
jgi:hypothetical protein